MYCPSCGSQTPDNSTFCLHCGKPIATSVSTQAVTEWEYKDFSLTWKPGTTGWCSVQAYSEPTARLYYWQNYQSEILPDLQKLLDAGWQPVTEIGPSCVQLRSFKSQDKLDLGQGLIVVLTLGAPVLFGWTSSWKYEMIGFQVKLRRPKR